VHLILVPGTYPSQRITTGGDLEFLRERQKETVPIEDGRPSAMLRDMQSRDGQTTVLWRVEPGTSERGR